MEKVSEEKAVLYSFKQGSLTRRIGYIKRISNYRSYFIEYSKTNFDETCGMYKPIKINNKIIVSSDPDKLFNGFVWFPLEDENNVFEENEDTLKAAELFKANLMKNIKKKEQELTSLYLYAITLNEITK